MLGRVCTYYYKLSISYKLTEFLVKSNKKIGWIIKKNKNKKSMFYMISYVFFPLWWLQETNSELMQIPLNFVRGWCLTEELKVIPKKTVLAPYTRSCSLSDVNPHEYRRISDFKPNQLYYSDIRFLFYSNVIKIICRYLYLIINHFHFRCVIKNLRNVVCIRIQAMIQVNQMVLRVVVVPLLLNTS